MMTREAKFRKWLALTISPEIAEEVRHSDLSSEAVHIMRETAREGLGFNCTFVDDNMKVIVGLAQRAVLAGLTSDFEADMQQRFATAAEQFRADHEGSLGYIIALR